MSCVTCIQSIKLVCTYTYPSVYTSRDVAWLHSLSFVLCLALLQHPFKDNPHGSSTCLSFPLSCIRIGLIYPGNYLWRRTVLHNIRFNVGKMTSTISLHPPPKFKITQTRQLVLSFQNVLYYCPFKTRNKTFSFKQELTAHFRGTICKSVTTSWNDSSQFKICCIFRSWQQDYRTILACQTLIVLIVWQHWLNFNCLP